MSRVAQEFYCQGCRGFILVMLNDQLTYHVQVCCPKCQRAHNRVIRAGCIEEAGRWNAKAREELYPTMGAWSDQPRTRLMQEALRRSDRRPGDAVLIRTPEDLANRDIINESWLERFSHRVFGT